MKKRLKIINLIFLVIIIFLISYLFVNIFIGNTKFQNLKSFLNFEQKQFIKRYIFPHKFISEQEKEFESTLLKTQQEFNSILLDLELEKIQNKDDIKIRESRVKLSNNYILKKYKLTTGFYLGINNLYPGSGYIDFYEDNIFIISSRGLLAFGKNFSKDYKNFKQIKNNIHDFIDLDQFKKLKDFSLKDILIFKDKVFISYTELIREDCWNTSIIYGVIDYENIKFKKLYSPDECVHLVNNIDKDFNAHQSGGRIISFEDNSILLSIGDYRSRYLAQDQKSINGKIIQININNGDFRIISIGHRNPQGLYFDRENNFILETEHGPMGGDEINLIELDKMNKDNFLNYGWPISSYGEHYSGVIKKTEEYIKNIHYINLIMIMVLLNH